MAKIRLSNLHYSQEAHKRLKKKAEKIPGKKGDIKYHYHNEVLIRQRAQSRILNKTERKSVFKFVSDYFKHNN